ncbi:MAG: pantoate--beta-alanine ligase [Sandaracinaceae bacterium]
MTSLLREPAAFRAWCDAARAEGHRVGLVPTMGALHAGHLSLVEAARTAGATRVVLTIFVNPLQFAAGDDLARYPRTLDDDLAACESVGVDAVFAPEIASMYPAGFSTGIALTGVTEHLEGEFRPDHFDGVATVVAKLFGLTGPCVAVFGRKDYQQHAMLRRMALDLDMPVEVVGAPIVREPDGLALSSRNVYLSAPERRRSLAIVTGLRAAWDRYAAGERDTTALESAARGPVAGGMDRIDYVRVATVGGVVPVEGVLEGPHVLAVAAHLGTTRLIDNVVLGHDPRP